MPAAAIFTGTALVAVLIAGGVARGRHLHGLEAEIRDRYPLLAGTLTPPALGDDSSSAIVPACNKCGKPGVGYTARLHGHTGDLCAPLLLCHGCGTDRGQITCPGCGQLGTVTNLVDRITRKPGKRTWQYRDRERPKHAI